MPSWRRGRPPRPVSTDEGYALWAETYDGESSRPLPRIEQRAILSLLPDVEGRACADLACGTGRYARLLRERGAVRAVAMDRNASMLRHAPSIAWRVRGDLAALPLRSASVDVAVCGLAYGHVTDLPAALVEARRILRGGGWLVFSDFHPEAVAAGMIRTFEARGRRYALPHHARTTDEVRAAVETAGLTIAGMREETAAGEPDAFGPGRLSEGHASIRLVLAIAARKP